MYNLMQGLSEMKTLKYLSRQLTVSHKGSLPSFDWATTVQSQNLQLSELAHPKDGLLPVLLSMPGSREDSNKQLINIIRVRNKMGATCGLISL
jgi:hypothetical protein